MAPNVKLFCKPNGNRGVILFQFWLNVDRAQFYLSKTFTGIRSPGNTRLLVCGKVTKFDIDHDDDTDHDDDVFTNKQSRAVSCSLF